MFSVNVVDQCSAVTLTPTVTSFATPQTYDVWTGSATTLGTAAFTSSDPLCPGISYTLLISGTTTTADSIFSLSGTQVKVQTSSLAKVASYTIDLKGQVGSYATAIFTFTVNVIDSCASITISTAPITSG